MLELRDLPLLVFYRIGCSWHYKNAFLAGMSIIMSKYFALLSSCPDDGGSMLRGMVFYMFFSECNIISSIDVKVTVANIEVHSNEINLGCTR